MSARHALALVLLPALLTLGLAAPKEPAPLIDSPSHIATDNSDRDDSDIVYVRAKRWGDKVVKRVRPSRS